MNTKQRAVPLSPPSLISAPERPSEVNEPFDIRSLDFPICFGSICSLLTVCSELTITGRSGSRATSVHACCRVFCCVVSACPSSLQCVHVRQCRQCRCPRCSSQTQSPEMSPARSMEQRKRILIFFTFFVCTACLALLTASLATHKWVVARPIRSNALNSSSFLFAEDRTQDDKELPKKFRGEIYFGLFQGTKVLNYGLGDRTAIIWLKQEMMSRNPKMMTFSLWLFTILSVSIAMIFGLVGAIFSIINTVMTPVETITGVQGLYLWNGLASLFCGGAAVTWIAQFVRNLSQNVLTEEEQNDGWTSNGKAHLGYSFYFVLVSGALHLVNIALVYAATRSPRRNKRAVLDKHPEGLIMLY